MISDNVAFMVPNATSCYPKASKLQLSIFGLHIKEIITKDNYKNFQSL